MELKPLRQSTLVLLVGIALFAGLILPTILSLFTEESFREQEFTTHEGQKLNCIVYSDYQAGGIDCFIDGEPLLEDDQRD